MHPLGGSPAKPPQRADPPRMLPGAVHELGESVNAIVAYVESARRLLTRQTAQPDDKIAEILGKASVQTDRATEVFRQLRALIQTLEESHGAGGQDFPRGAAE